MEVASYKSRYWMQIKRKYSKNWGIRVGEGGFLYVSPTFRNLEGGFVLSMSMSIFMNVCDKPLVYPPLWSIQLLHITFFSNGQKVKYIPYI